ncbi:MAG: ABC transporter ATP-binding protein [Clostridia bacterium]
MKYLLKLIGFVKPLRFSMLFAVLCGTIGHLLAISIPVLSILAVLASVDMIDFSVKTLFIALGFASVLRGIFAYLEQQRNHYIAFTILAIIRDKIFGVLRKLAPAKLDNKNRGNLISIITSDIELLEVFFAHTISPVVIAMLVSIIVAGVMFAFEPILAVISLLSHITIGFLLPFFRSRKNESVFDDFRNQNGELSSYYLDGLRGLDEILQMQNGEKRVNEIIKKTENTEKLQIKKANLEGNNNAVAEICVFSSGLAMLIVSSMLSSEITSVIVPTVLMMSSFGPFLSLSKLTVGLGGTKASAKRVLELMEEEPEVLDVNFGATPNFDGVLVQNLSFSYNDKKVIDNLSLNIDKITSVIGKSGSGKSTLVKLIMRFWESDGITIGGQKLSEIDTKHLRKIQSYMTQDTDIFSSTIIENIKIGKLEATDEEVIEASKKASLHDFVMSLKDGYNTKVGELGDTISGGEKQRIGLARAFLHGGELLVLDEPTSNLDSLNESIILKSIKDYNKTTILISHRKSTLGISDFSFYM